MLSIVSAEDELRGIAQQEATRWVDGALAPSIAVEGLFLGRGLPESEEAHLATLANGGNVVQFEIFGLDGTPIVAYANGTFRDVGAMPSDPQMVLEAAEGRAVADIRHGTDADGMPPYYSVLDVPLRRYGQVVGMARVYSDESGAKAVYDDEMVRSMVLSSVLAGLALTSSIAIGFLLHRQQRADARIHHLAHHDPLTGVANRHQYQEFLAETMDAVHRGSETSFALHLLDLDGFKHVNDTLGHDVGDGVLRRVAREAARLLGPEDLLARLGGDEFAIVQRRIANPEAAEALAAEIIHSVSLIDSVEGQTIRVSASVGITIAPAHACDVGDLQKCADVALYRAKESGRDRAVTFEAGMDVELRERALLRMKIRAATETMSFELYFQPIHRATDGALTGFEALLRLPDGEGGHIPPGIFIPVAEEMCLTPRIGAWVLRQACIAAATWDVPLSISVNLSPQQFEENVVREVEAALTQSNLEPDRLGLEVTESLLIKDPEAVGTQLSALKDLGVRLVMDDFGTGYSSLSYLWKFPFDKVKVDRSCFMSLGQAERVGEVLRTISAMSDAMDLEVTAEGIETEYQRDFARLAGYDELQGFLYSRPMPETEVLSYIRRCTTDGMEFSQEGPIVVSLRA
ncbi:putative bifunctional diguanylate cyclase/phosphodiesterase [Acuticoccus kandeliae]|uniref:putative bifunctional diguanylate cyclase/phosphodiesterase n=1 Tax=Acuticoccus kandeliae TaxID=2073160 RepID=UPI001474B4E4|nr:EAL domain-containing protein [Acuticoccus kandeliae]